MEVSEYSKIVLERIQIMEPQNATRIIGYLLLNFTHQEIKEFAFGSDDLILLLINEAKDYLASSPKPIIPNPIHGLSRSFSSPSSFRLPAPNYPPFNSVDTLPSYMEEQLHATNPLGLDFSSNCSYSNSQLGGGGLFEFQNKPCHYFFKGHCRNGNGCKFLHADSFSQMCNMNPNELLNDDHIFSRSSLERLEVEISELLKASKGMPVSIASLPSLYLDMYGKTLQADGYLTESQRHGKAGFSLTKLLGRLNSIRLIDRPHGQHAVVLAEDAPKYDYRNDRYEQGALHASSHQIYLTFPAESSFTDKDVLNYFRQYGPVRDVRIPRQEKRMFGFVSFQSPDSVKIILSKSHPHFICGSRVLVKPYKEKTRKYTERAEFPYYPPYFTEMELDLHTMPRVYDTTLLEKQLMEEQQYALQLRRKEEQQWELELERRCLQLQLSPRPLSSNPYLNCGMEEFKAPADHFSPSPFVQDNGSSRDDYTERTAKLFSPLPLVQGNGSSRDDNTEQTSKIFNEQDCGHIELPDSPFASLA